MLIDNNPLSYGNSITDWELGDDRIVERVVASSSLIGGDSLTDAFYTIKANQVLPDAQATVQVHITTAASNAGQITGSPALSMLFNIFSASYQSFVTAGAVYYYDIRVLTADGHTWTIETGTIQWQQNVTQANIGGVPAVFPNDGQPIFRGFTATKPDLIPSNFGLYNTGDVFFNSNPINNNGLAFFCTIGGQPGTWVTIFPSGGTIDPNFLGYSPIQPATVATVGQYYLNSNPVPNGPEGWVYTSSGWKTKGIVGS